MNKTFKHVTNTKNGELVSGVAAETARTAGGLGAASVAVGTGPAQASAKATLWGLKAMAWAVLALCGSLSHAAAPVGVVAHGEASLVTQGSVLNVHQSSKAATINFQQLNLGKGEGVAVQARSASDITLLRVAGGMNVNGGFVTANNNLMISSPSGIAVSNGGKVSAQGEVYMTTQNMAVGQYTKPAARASAGAISVTGHSQISGSNIVLDAGSIHLSQATLTAAPVQKTDGITLQAATVSVQDSSLNAAGGQISIGLDPQGTYAQSTTISASTLSAQAVQVAGIELKVDSTNTLTTETARLQTVDMKIDADLAQLTSNVLATGSDVQLQGDNSVSMARDVAIEVNSSHSNALRIANTGSQQNNPNAPSSPTAPKPNQVAILGTVNLNGGRKSLSVHSAGDLTLDGTRTDVSGDTTFQSVGTIVVNAAHLTTVGDLTIGRDAFGQGALSLHTVVFDSTLKGYNIETSGDTLTTQGVTARTTGGEWLLDPTNITISSAASTGGSLAAAQGQAGATTISTTDIQNAINAGTSVNVVGSGTITLSNNLSFANSTANATLTLDNTSGSKQGITLTGGIAATGTSLTSVVVKSSGGTITVNGAINVTGSINLDNSFGGTAGPGGTATSGFLLKLSNQTTANTNTSGGVIVSQTLTATGSITLKGATRGNGLPVGTGVQIDKLITAGNGISISGSGGLLSDQTGLGVYVNAGLTANGGDIVIKGQSYNYGIIMRTAQTIMATNGSVYIAGSSVVPPSSTYTNHGIEFDAGYRIIANNNIDLVGFVGATAANAYGTMNAIGNNGNYNNLLVAKTGYITLSGGTHQGPVTTTKTAGGIVIGGLAARSAGAFTIQGATLDSDLWAAPAAGTSANTIGNMNAVNIGNYAVTVTGTTYNGTYDGIQAGAGIHIAGSGLNASTIVNLNALKLTNTTEDIYISAVNAAGGSNTGITTSGAITQNQVGGDISFISNQRIIQTGNVAVVANTSGTVADVLYDTRTGTSGSTIRNGALSVGAGTSTSAINFSELTNGALITNGGVTVPGYILIDNTNGSSSTATLANVNGATITGALSAGTLAGSTGVRINTVSSGTGVGIQDTAAITALAGPVTLTSISGTANSINLTATSSITSAGGVSIIGTSSQAYAAADTAGAYGAVSVLGQITNTGAGGVVVRSTANTATGAINDSSTGGISITGGYNIAAGTVTGGTITAVGTLDNTGGGVISLSMAQPTSATGGAIETAAGVTSANASVSSNVSYGNVGGVMGAVNAATVNTVNYRNTLSGSTSITLEVENYSQVYGTSYSGTIANGWLSNSSNVTVSAVTGSSSGFGIASSTPSNADVLSSLRFAGNLGSAGNSNLVQSGTNLSVLGAITSSYGAVTVTPRSGKNTYTITPAPLTITGRTAAKVYDGVSSYADVSVAGTTYAGLVSSIGGVLTGDAVTSLTRVITTAADTATPISGLAVVGSYVDTLSNAVGSGLSNYTITYAPGAFAVTPAALTVTGGSRTTTYNATQQNNATYSVGGLLGADTVTSVGGVVASGINAGTYNDSLSGALGTGLSNYTINYVNGALTINKAALNIAAVAGSSVYTAGVQTATYTVTGLQGTVDGVTAVNGLASETNAGSYTSNLSGATGTGLANYDITYTNAAPFTITKANATLVGVLNNTAAYNGSAQTNTGAVFTGLLGDDATTISASGYAQATNVAQGTVADNLSATGADSGNYNFTVTNGSLRITPAALSVVGAQTTTVYNAATQTNTRTITGLVGGDAISVTGSASARNVSTTNDALSVAFTSGAASNYTTTITDGFLKITPAIISVSGITAANKEYNGTTSATLSGTPTISGVLGGDAVSVNAGSLTGVFDSKNAGSQNVSISGIGLTGADAFNYQLSGGTTATTTATITPKTLNVTGTSLTTTYNGGVQSLAAPVVDGLVTGDNVTIGGNASGTNAGTYTATYTVGGTDAGNYNLVSPAPATLTVNKAALVVTADNSGKIVTQTDPTLTAQLSGLQGSDTASGLGYTYTISRAAGENAGAYAITPTGVASLTNYTVSYVPGQFTITPAGTVLIKMNPTTSTYGTVVGGTIASVEYVASSGGSLRTLSLKPGTTNVYTDGISGGGEITITPTTSVTTTTDAGTYVGAISNTNTGTAASNNNFTGVETIVNTAVVNPANLTLALAPVTKTYDGTAFAATGVSVTPTGLMNGQTLAGLGGLTYSGTAIGAINASTTPYSLVGSVGSGFANYNVTIAPSTVTINKAPLQITGGTNTYTFDNTTRTNTYSVTGGQLFANDSITGLTGRAARLHAGATADTLSAATGTGLSNYNISYVNGGLTINPAQLTALATPTNAPVYNGGTAVPNTTVLSGVIGGTLVSGTTSLALSGANVGAQTIVNSGTVLSGPNAGDYVVVSSNLVNTTTNQVTPNIVSTGNGGGSVTITPAPLTITGGTTSHVFNNTQRTNTYSVTSGTLHGSDSVTGVTGLGTGLRANTSANLVYADNLSGATGSGLANYAITYVNGGLTITRAPLTALATPNATTYSGGTSVANTTALSGVIAGTTVAGTTSLVMGSPNAGTQTITNNGTTLSGDFASDYEVVSSNLVGTTPNQVTPTLVSSGNGGGTIVVAKAPLTITGATTQAVYNGTQQTNTATVTGAVNGEQITTSGSAVATNVSQGTVNDALVAVAGSGVNLNNYQIAISQGSLEITPATLTVSGITANGKPYDGTDAATLSVSSVSYNGVFAVDANDANKLSVNTASLQGLFADANAGENKDVLVSGISITGSASSNYQLSGGNSLVVAGTITPAPLTITGGNASHVFNNTTRTNTFSVSGTLYGSDSVTGVMGSGTGLHAGTHADNLSAAVGFGISNYDVTYVNGALTITRAPLNALATPLATTYSGGINVANTTALSGVIAGTDVSGITSLVLGSPNAGLQNIINNGTTLSGPNGGDYEVVSSNLVGTTPNQVTPNLVTTGNGGGSIVVAKAPLSLVGDTSSVVYNGTAQTNTVTITGAVNNEAITASGSAQATHVSQGTVGDVLVAVAGSGVNLNNYAITITNGSLNITPATITLGGITANNKVYDGTDSATLNVGTVSFNGVLPVDDGNVTVNTSALTAQFDGDAAQDGKTVYISGISIGGAAASNYQLSGSTTATATANITAAPLTITGGTTSHVFNNTQRTNTYSVTGQLFGSDSVTGVTGLGTGLRANTSANLVYADNLSGATGNGINNYAITYVNGGLTITPAPLTALATPNATTYSGGTNVANTTALSGIIAGTTVSGTTSLVLGSPNAGTQTIINNGTTLSGDFASDYYVVSSNLVGTTPNQVTPNLVATGNGGGSIVVAKAPATVLAIASSATADGTMKTQGYTQTGVMAGDDLGVSGLASGMLAGEYASALSASNPNYDVVFVDAPLEILASKALELPQAEPPHPVPFVWAPHPAPLEPLDPFCGLSVGLQEIQLAQAMASKAPAQVCGFDTSVLFDFGSAVLNAPAKEQLRQCQFDPSKPLLISGFVDAEGTRLANIGLGKRRALAVKDFMASELRVPTQNIRMRLRDKTNDAAVSAAEWGQAASCRVHVSQVPDKR